MNALVETCRGVAYPWHGDHMGHMNVMWYVDKFDEAGITADIIQRAQKPVRAYDLPR